MLASSNHETIKNLLQAYLALKPQEPLEPEDLANLLAQRQEIIDQIDEIDETLALVKECIAESPELKDLLTQIADLDKRLLDNALTYKEQLRASLGHTNHGRRAARGYRLRIPNNPAIIDKRY